MKAAMEKAAAEYEQSVRQAAAAGGAAAGGGAGPGKGTKGSGKEKEPSGQSGAGGKGPAGGQGQGKAAAAGGPAAGAGKQGAGQQGGKGGVAASVGQKAHGAPGAAGAAATGGSYIPGFNDADASSSRSSTAQRGPSGGAGRGPSAPVIQPYTTTVGGNGVNGFVPGTGQYGGRGRGLARGRGGPQAGGRGAGRGGAGGVGLWQVRGPVGQSGWHHVALQQASASVPGCAWLAPVTLMHLVSYHELGGACQHIWCAIPPGSRRPGTFVPAASCSVVVHLALRLLAVAVPYPYPQSRPSSVTFSELSYVTCLATGGPRA